MISALRGNYNMVESPGGNMRNRNRAGISVPPELILLWGALLFASGLALANPTGPTVVNGTATFQQSGNLLQVTNSPSAIINWQGFSIPVGEITRFNQQTAASAVLNRVTTQNPSAILGALQSNGRVFLINPNGILFGASAQIDVAGLVASTLNLSDPDFLGARLRFTAAPGAGSVVNQGAINSAPGGHVYLVGPAVTNSGVITSPKGEVILAAGNSVDLVDPQTPNLRVEITAPDNQALNLGQITADAGRVGIYAGLINHSGTIRADSAVATADGKIIFRATKNATLETGSVTTANGPAGGRIEIQAGDTALVAGTVEAKGREGSGGTVHVLGNQVGLIDNASINASGESGGGTVLVGGDYKGDNAEIQNASRTYFGRDATIAADAITGGDGGKVVVWSNDATRAYGSISARGGAQSGNGGLVEVSGRNWLDFAARVDTTAPNGATGTLLLDPTDITIGGGATSGGTCPPAGPCFDLVGNPSSANLNAADLIAALGTSNVTVSTSSGGSGAGDISVISGVPYSSTNSLTLHADRDLNMVTFGGSIINSGAGALTFEAGRDFNLRDAAVLAVASPLSISAGGNLNVTAVTQPTLIQAGTLNVNVAGGLRVQAGTAPTARASVASLNGQTINAGFVEVTAQANNNADISNFTSGNQTITVAGSGVSPGIDVQALASGGVASIANNAAGGAQTITVTDADHIIVNGVGGGASIFAPGGTQTVSISGVGANALTVGGAGALGFSQLAGKSQDITAGASGESGSISIVGSAANAKLAGFVSAVGSGNFQTLSTSGTLSITGGSAPAQLPNFPAGIFHNGTGQQTVSAAGIVLQGGSSGSGNRALIVANNGSQQINAGAGAITLMGGSGGADNSAAINQNFASPGLTQTITVDDGGSLSLQGGSSGTGNFAQVRAAGGLQTITAGDTTITAGLGGVTNFAAILAPTQVITVHGDLTLTGGGSAASGAIGGGARIGGFGGASPSPTNLILIVDGDVAMTGGSVADAGPAIGSGLVGGQRTDIAITAGGDVTLNPGSIAGAGSRIGSPSSNVAGGNIVVNAGGNIALNSAGPGLGTGIFTLDTVALSTLTPGMTITEGADSIIRSDSLGVTANGDISLVGANQVGTIFSGGTGLGGSLAFNNTSPALTVPSISLAGGGALTLNQAGNLFISGNVSSGAQTITATGDITVAPSGGPGMSVSASGAQTLSAGGTLLVQGGPGTNSFAQIVQNGTGPQSVSAAGIVLQGGSSGSGNSALISANNGSQLINAGAGGITLIGGSGGANNFVGINQNGTSSALTQTVAVNDGGSISIQGGSGGTTNQAQIRALGGLQTVTTGNTTLNGGTSSVSNFALILAPVQLMTVHGDLTLTGGDSAVRIGGLGGATPGPTNLALTVDGDLTMTAGNVANANSAIGSSQIGGLRSDITMNVGGDVTLNPGSVAGAESRIGSPSGNVAGGNIFVNAGGNIALNSAGPGLGTGIFTLDTVSLGALTPGMTITQGADSIIRADSLGVGANGDISLVGANQVGTIFSGGTGLGGSLAFNNTSPALTVPSISLAGGGALTLNQAGNLSISGNVSSGAQTITATGDITVAPSGGPGMSVSASGAQTLSAGGTLTVQGGSAVDGRAVVTGSGPTNVTVGNELNLAGGSGQNAQALLFSNSDINLTVGGALRLNAGSGDNAWARVQTATHDSMINIYFPNLSSGGYFVNDIEGALRRGLTGILSGMGVAVPDQTLDITYGQ
jgi:filamentous hemagglutinin family protein